MKQIELEAAVKNLNDRVTRIEEILPTLATKADLGPLSTKTEVREEGERTRRHFDVVAERIEGQVRLVAEGHAWLAQKLDALSEKGKTR